MIQILSLIKNKGDHEKSNILPIFMRSPWYESLGSQEAIQNIESPRVLSSHLQLHMFAKSYFKSKAKIVYTLRNPKDVVVSLFYFTKILKIYKAPEEFQEVLEDFIQGNALYGSWFDHVKGWMQMKDDSRFFFITYEELLQDLRGCVIRICKFLGQDLNDVQIDSVVKHSTFKSMAENVQTNWTKAPTDVMDQSKGSFLRKGVSGDWKNHFTVAQSEYFDKVYQEKMKDLNMNFFWEQSS
ncbi:sulfotransferase 2B1-like [Dendropsophus ebraccatus]|uniref:sulfotransferase 2B1-like n=1 Tax=Dendropsophus ebraccatus TaxID=150705 RepID=UPI003831AA2D